MLVGSRISAQTSEAHASPIFFSLEIRGYPMSYITSRNHISVCVYIYIYIYTYGNVFVDMNIIVRAFGGRSKCEIHKQKTRRMCSFMFWGFLAV